MAALAFTASGKQYSFNWADPGSLTPSFGAPNSSNRYGEYISNVTFHSGPVSLLVNDDDVLQGSQKARFLYGYMTQTVEMRAYANSVLEFSVSQDSVITEIKFVQSVADDVPLDFGGTNGTLDGNTWTASNGEQVHRVIFDVIATTNLTNTVVTVEAADGGLDAVGDIVIDGDASEEWYTLQGIRLSRRPTVAGLFIRKSSEGTSKVLLTD